MSASPDTLADAASRSRHPSAVGNLVGAAGGLASGAGTDDAAAGAGSVPATALREALDRLDVPFRVTREGIATDGSAGAGAVAPACTPDRLGDASFRTDHGLRLAYVAGAMANGIGSCELVESMARSGGIGFFGAAGLAPAAVEDAVARLSDSCAGRPWGANLIHSPAEPAVEDAVARLYEQRGVTRVSASAYLRLTLPVVRYRLAGITQAPDGTVVTPNRVLAKVSRVEVATRFMSPAPDDMLAELVRRGDLTERQAGLARRVPIAQDVTAEADSGGHTDNRPALALLPTVCALRDRIAAEHGYDVPLRVGLAGGIATPEATSAAFALGAAYVMTGSVNQACVEAGTSDVVRTMLAGAGQADCTMAPAADMFEMGVRVQVLKRGTLFPMRARRLFELYRARDGLDDLTATERTEVEQRIFRRSFADVWRDTEAYFGARDPAQLERAARDPKHRMALVFRWYLGKSSAWANTGVPDRQVDYQVWCGPSMGAFNAWTAGGFLEAPAERRVALVMANLMRGAAVLSRVATLRSQGLSVPAAAIDVAPRTAERLQGEAWWRACANGAAA